MFEASTLAPSPDHVDLTGLGNGFTFGEKAEVLVQATAPTSRRSRVAVFMAFVRLKLDKSHILHYI